MSTKTRSVNLIPLVLVLFMLSLLPSSSVKAYKSLPPGTPKLPGAATSMSVFYDHINTGLNIANSGTLSSYAINQWSLVSTYALFDSLSAGPNTATTNTIRVVAFHGPGGYQTNGCGNLNVLPTDVPAGVCGPERNIYLNSDPVFQWNTNGIMNYSQRKVDYLTVLLNRIGALWGLTHPPATPSAVMHNNWTTKQLLNEDDRRGATQLYGPETGFETNATLGWLPGYSFYHAQGNENVVAEIRDVSSASLRPVAGELGVTPFSGSRYLRLTGSANASYSYTYMKLFTANNDELGSNAQHATLTGSSSITWYQYNHTKARMGIDILFIDSGGNHSWLRNSGLNDQNGVPVHPNGRGGYPIGSWFYVQVNLGSLAGSGKRIKEIYVAYDSSIDTGTFRGYFDEIEFNP